MSQLFASGGQYWSFSFSFRPCNKYSGLISFRMDWLYLLEVQGTLKSLLQHHGSKASILWGSAFFIVQLSHPYMTTGKTIALTRQIFVDKVMSLLFNMLSKLVIIFLPKSKLPSAVIWETYMFGNIYGNKEILLILEFTPYSVLPHFKFFMLKYTIKRGTRNK